MSRDCERCILKHGGKITECDYSEVNEFIENINNIYGTEYELIECPDEDDDTIYTVDLEYMDKSADRRLYVEVKEVKFGFEGNGNIAEDKGQLLIGNCINEAIENLSVKKKHIIDGYSFIIPQEQLGSDEEEIFINRMTGFLNDSIIEQRIKNNKFIFKRNKKNKTIIIEIVRKNDELNNINQKCIFAYNAKGQSIDEIFKIISDQKTLLEKIEKNLSKTENTKNKFPINESRKILLQILRLPIGMEVFLNFALMKGCINNIIENLIEKNDEYQRMYPSVDESYLVFYFDEYYVDILSKKTIKGLLCIPIVKGLIKDANMFYEEIEDITDI